MIPLRLCHELTYQLEHASEHQRLLHALTTIPVFMVLYRGETEYEVLQLWAKLGAEHEIVEGYRQGLEKWRRTLQGQSPGHQLQVDDRLPGAPGADIAGSVQLDCYERVAELLDRVGRWDGAAELYTQVIAIAQTGEDRARLGTAHRGLGMVRWYQGRYDEAMDQLTVSRAIHEALGDRLGMSIAIGSMGLVYYVRGEYDRALECYGQQEATCRELGDRRGLSTAIGNIGNVYQARGEHELALECFRQKEAICRELGNRSGLSNAIGNMSNVFSARGEYDRALECYGQQEAICRELGDRNGLSSAIGNMGSVYNVRGEYDRALECYGQQEAICRELGDRRGLSSAIGNMGVVCCARGEYDRALECYGQQEAICRELGDRNGLSSAIGNMGVVYCVRGEYEQALDCYGQQEAIYRELGDPGGLSCAFGNMGNVHHARGEYERALECYQLALAGHREIGVVSHVTYWLSHTVEVLLERVAQPGEMPEYLWSYLPNAAEATWRRLALEQARVDAEECISLSEQLSIPVTLFSGGVLLARVAAAEGHRDVAVQRLYQMLTNATDDDQRAELHYWLWKLGGPEHHAADRAEALMLYTRLVEKTPNHDCRTRIEELEGEEKV